MKVKHTVVVSDEFKSKLEVALKNYHIPSDAQIQADILMYNNPSFEIKVLPMDESVFFNYALLKFFKVFNPKEVKFEDISSAYKEYNKARNKAGRNVLELNIEEDHIDKMADVVDFFKENKYIIDRNVFTQYIVSWYIKSLE